MTERSSWKVRHIGNSSWSWGRDLMQNLVNGINWMINDLYNAVCDVANLIWEYLHFSVPEKGPLTSVNSWMPDFMENLADGINKSKKIVAKAVESVAESMQITANADIGFNGMTSPMKDSNPLGTVINNYNNDNSRTINQTNNSPKSLSRLEIYRQTRNAMKM